MRPLLWKVMSGLRVFDNVQFISDFDTLQAKACITLTPLMEVGLRSNSYCLEDAASQIVLP